MPERIFDIFCNECKSFICNSISDYNIKNMTSFLHKIHICPNCVKNKKDVLEKYKKIK